MTVNFHPKDDIQSRFEEVLAYLKPDLKKVDEIILDSAKGKAELVLEIANYLVSSGGKRIRPILLILAAKLCGYKNGEEHYNLAVAVELIHAATLLHDDVVDNSQFRRKKKTVNAIWDNKASILVGDFLFSLAFKFMTKTGDLRILQLLSDTSNTIADGEILQLVNSSNIDLSKEKYLEIIHDKTAILFAAATQSAALLSQKSQKEILALNEFGKNLGVVFQIVDDVLDYSSSKEILGKDIGDDFFEGKVTLPIILAYEKASEQDKKIISDLFAFNLINDERRAEDFDMILKLIRKYNAIDAAIAHANYYRDLCFKNISIFPDNKYRQYLLDIVDYSLCRLN